MLASREAPLTSWVVPLAFALLAFAALTYTTADADLWGHLRFGLDLLRSHHLTAVDPYSFTQDKPWINHEWLSELQMAFAWTLGGAAGLALIKGAFTMGGFTIAWVSWRGARLVWRIAAIAVLAAGTIHVTSSIRPQVWSFLFLAILCRVLATDSARGRWALPLMFIAWANCHGGWIVGMGVLGLWAAIEVVTTRRRVVMWSAVIVLSLAATLVNPYGVGLWRFLAETVRPTRSIAEWGPLLGTPVINWIPWILATVAAAWAAARQSSPTRWQTIVVLVVLAYESFRVMRVESLYVEAAAILLGSLLAETRPAGVDAALPVMKSHADRVAVAIITLLPVAGAVWLFTQTLTCLRDLSIFRPDADAARALEQTRGDGTLVTFFDWGEYAIWHFGPRLLVSMDGRRETVYTDARIAQHDGIVNGTSVGFDALTEWRADYVWLPITSQSTRAWLMSHGYRIDVETPKSFIAVRADLPALKAVLRRPSTELRCFPE